MIELIIYLAIVSTILVSISYLMIDILAGQTRNYTNQDINQQLRFVSGVIAKDIRSAQAVGSITSDSLVLVTPEDDIILNFDTANKILTRQIGSADPIALHDFQVEATGNFADLSYLERSKNIKVVLNFNYSNPDNRSEYNASTTGIFSVELRGRR